MGDMTTSLPVATASPAAAAAPVRKVAILAIVLSSYFMILLDNSVIFTALPSLQADLDLSTAQLSWVQDAYTLVFGGFLLLGARAGDLLGRRRVFVFGLVVFSLASLLVGVAPTGWWAIASRALQGIGAAIVAPASLSLITASFPAGRERSRAVALYGATAGIGASLGLVIGGALAHWISWRAGFFVNVPVGLAMILLAPRYLPETERSRGRFDVVGAVAATAGVGALVYGIIHAASSSWTDPATIGAIAAGLVMLALLVLNESRVAAPIMPLHLFASRVRTGAYVARLVYMGGMMGFFYFTTQYLQGVLGMNPLQAGMGFLPMTAVNFVVAMQIPRLVRRVGERLPLLVGIALTVVGMAWLGRLGVESTYLVDVALPMLAIGAGQGLVFAPLTSFGIAGATEDDAGAASGLVNTFHQLGMAIGLGVLVVIAEQATSGGGADAAVALAGEVSAALTGAAVLLALACVAVAVLIAPVTGTRAPSLAAAPGRTVDS